MKVRIMTDGCKFRVDIKGWIFWRHVKCALFGWRPDPTETWETPPFLWDKLSEARKWIKEYYGSSAQIINYWRPA